MADLKFQLFRARVELPTQQQLLASNLRPAEIFERAIRDRPSSELRRGHIWHIGNIADLDSAGVYFALGRTTKTVLEHFDDDTGNFVEHEFQFAPFTHVLADTRLELCAIAHKQRLSTSIYGIANKLGALLGTSSTAREQSAVFKVLGIDDPREFIQLIRTAHAVSYFSMTFHRPNPFDPEKLIRQPLGRYLLHANGDEGTAVIKGDHLDQEALAEVARSTVAEGDEAKAKIQAVKSSKAVMRHSKGTPVVVREDAVETRQQKLGLLEHIRGVYKRIKGEAGWDK